MKKLIVTLLALGLLSASAQQPWTLRQCIDYALENNIDIKQIELIVEESELDLSSTRFSRLPDLAADLSQSFNFGQSPVRTFDADQNQWTDIYRDSKTTTTNFSVTSSIPVFSGFRISNQIKSDKLNLKAALENLNKAKENLELQVTSLYLEALFRKEIAVIYRQQADYTATQLEKTGILVESGKVPRSQYFDMAAKLAEDRTDEVSAMNEAQLALLNLAQALSIADPGQFDIAAPAHENIVSGISSLSHTPEEIYEVAIGIKPHVKESFYKLESSRANVRIAQSALWPTLSIGVGYYTNYYYVFNTPGNIGFGTQLRKQGSESVGFNLNIPIFNRMYTRNKIRSATLAVRNRELELDAVKLDIYKQVRQAHQSAVAAEAKLISAEKSVEAAQESFNYMTERYDLGKSTAYELDEVQTRLVTSRSQLVQARYEMMFRIKIIDFYRGIPIDIL